MKQIILFVAMSLGFAAQAAVDPDVTVSGIVVGFDSKVIKIFDRGHTVHAPRKKGPRQLRRGDHIVVSYDLEQFKKELDTYRP